MSLKFNHSISILPLALVLTACASAPEDIAPINVSINQYAGLSCSQLIGEKAQLDAGLVALSAQQRNAQTGDAMGVFLLGLPISSMTGSDKETEIAYTKGKQLAVGQQLQIKRCSV